MRQHSILSATFIVFLLSFFSLQAQAQKTVVAGKIVDKVSGESLIGAAVKAVGPVSKGAVTDYDGNFVFEVEPGTYTVTISYTSYREQVIEGFECKAGATNTLDVALETADQTITEVVITATTVRNTDASLIALQRKSLSIQDGISSQQIGRTGVTNAADAMKQVTGAVVEGGKYIVMRGLGDRYSVSQLNGITMPSTDPYRNSSSLDLIPSQMIENIVTLKTFTPDQPGNFSGGLVNVTTKSFPDKFNIYFGLNSSFNTQASGINNFLGHGSDAGDLDWLGYDDGGRALPDILKDENNRNQLTQNAYLDARNPKADNNDLRQLMNQSSRELSNVFTPTQKNTPVNHGFTFSLGDNKRVFGNTLGYSFGVNYSREFLHYDNGVVNTYVTSDPQTLFGYQKLRESKSVETPHLGGLFNLSYKLGNNHGLTFNLIYNNDAEIIGRTQEGSFAGQVSTPGATFLTNSMEFIRRQYTSYQLSGRHVMPEFGGVEIDWSGSINNSSQQEPDTRYFAYLNYIDDDGNNTYAINDAEFRPPFHFFRELNDKGYEGKVDITVPFLRQGNASSTNAIKFGGMYSNLQRGFSEYQFSHQRHGGVPSDIYFNQYQGDFEGFFSYDNFGVVDTTYFEQYPDSVRRYDIGYYYVNQVNNRNFYDGDQTIAAAYLMGIYNVLPRLKLIAGVRMESTDMLVVSKDTSIQASKIDITDPLYSGSLIYTLTEKSNLRFAATQTLARPNMRELAPFAQFDTKNGFFNVGNPDLTRTLIQNYDLRYEVYPNFGELIAVSVFYKRFEDPILRRFDPSATIPTLGYTNIDEAMIYGAEFEVRKNLAFIGGKFMQNMFLSTNVAFIHSEYKIPQDELNSSLGVDSTYDLTTRPFQSQSPFIVNAALSYINPERGWESSVSFNISGSRLYNISLAATPDVYEAPVPLLNFNISKTFFDHYRVGFSAQNILNPVYQRTQNFKGTEYIAESATYGTKFGLSLAYFIR
ncbi:MAG: TonB-dependent receptor [Saprospiraceae bacterium]|nr:TonB-dependent receptor [Saprospiraceae bacterium]